MQTEQQSLGELLPQGDKTGFLAIPVEVIPQIYVESGTKGVKRAVELKVTNAEEYAAMADIANGLQKLITTGEQKTLDAGRPFRDQGADISKRGKVIIAVWQEGKEIALTKMRTWKADEDAKIAAAIKIQQEQQAKEEAARREVENKRKLLEIEATAKEELAAKKIELHQTPAQLQKAIAIGEQAQELRSQVAEMESSESMVPFVPSSIEIPDKVQAKGVKDKRVVKFLEYDIQKLDRAFLVCDEKKLKKAILDGYVKPGTPGVVFQIGTEIGLTGR